MRIGSTARCSKPAWPTHPGGVRRALLLLAVCTSGTVALMGGCGADVPLGGPTATGGMPAAMRSWARPSSLESSCWTGVAECDPRDATACGPGAGCDAVRDSAGQWVLRCVPTPTAQKLGEHCNNRGGPFCEPGLRCAGQDGRCARVCCGDADCSGGERCAAIAASTGTLGVCLEPEQTAIPCAQCGEQANAQCDEEVRQCQYCPNWRFMATCLDSCSLTAEGALCAESCYRENCLLHSDVDCFYGLEHCRYCGDACASVCSDYCTGLVTAAARSSREGCPGTTAGTPCSDDCILSRDGQCDDGGPGAVTMLCWLGTDCSDCGPRRMESWGEPTSDVLCSDDCWTARDGECTDGGPNARVATCSYGTDCSDCGARQLPTSGSSGTGGAGAGATLSLSPALADAIQRLASAFSGKDWACEPGQVRLAHGDSIRADQRMLRYLSWLVSLPDTGLSSEHMRACADAAQRQSCEEFLSARTPTPVECQTAGLRAVGEPCADSEQCTTGYCTAVDYGCGTCTPLPKPGDPCSRNEHCGEGEGLVCSEGGTCKQTAAEGAQCGDQQPCDRLFDCVQGTCMRKQTAVGDPCGPDAGTPSPWCDLGQYLVCAPQSNSCVRFDLAAAGESCVGAVLCEARGTCDGGSCVRGPGDGDPCDDSQRFCAPTSRCVRGRCVPPPTSDPCAP
jgi:hypothetical protein